MAKTRHLWHTIRCADGTWQPTGDVEGQFAIPGSVMAVAGTCGTPGETQWLLTTDDGHLRHTLRRTDGSWTGLGDVQGELVVPIPGRVTTVAAALGAAGETQFMFTTNDGRLWHTLRRVDGSWAGLRDVERQFAIPGRVTAVAGTGGAPGETQWLFSTADGHLWHTLRRRDASWTGLGTVDGEFVIPGRVLQPVAAALGDTREAQFMFATIDGHLWHTLRRAGGVWTGLGDAQSELGVTGPVSEAAGASGRPGETQWLLATPDGHLWHALRRTNGRWAAFGQVGDEIAVAGQIGAVAAALGAVGETQFMFTTLVGPE